MKLAIWSDLHIGKRMYRTDENNYNKYEQIGYKVLMHNVNVIKKFCPDLVINAGDVFDTPNPSVLAMNKYFQAQKSFADANISGTAKVFGNARVYCDARIYGDACVRDNANIYGHSKVCGNAMVFGNANVSGNVCVTENAKVYGDAILYGDVNVCDYAHVDDNVMRKFVHTF